MSMHIWLTRVVVLAVGLATACGDNLHPGTAAIVVTPLAGLVTTEAGGQATFTIVLGAAPYGDVSIALSSSNSAEGRTDRTALTFTTASWDAPQTVTVTGINDDLTDGSQTYTILTAAATSSDRQYDGVDPDDVSLANTDDDRAGITVTPIAGLVTTEAGGTASFDVVLDSRPAATVEIGLMSSDVGEGTVGLRLMFTADNWKAPQHVTVTGIEDALADGPQGYTIQTLPAVSTDVTYNGLDAADVTASNTDNDSPGITVTPTTGLVTNENGAQASFTIVLNSQPAGPVTIALDPNDLTEGTTSPTSITFTPLNWNAPQSITITGQDDDVADGNEVYAIVTAAATSSDAGYNGLEAADVIVTNTDNDSAGITVSAISGLTTDETGVQATLTIVLNSQPTAGVTIDLSSSDTTEGTISPSSVTFTTTAWNAPQTITITGQDDNVADGNQPYAIITAPAISTDPAFRLDAADISVTNNDNDTAGVLVNPISGLTTSEAGGNATYAVALRSQPLFDVTIPISTSDASEGRVSPTSLTFTTVNWNAPQVVTLQGIDDAVADGNQVYTIANGLTTSADPRYDGLDPSDVSMANIDNDSAGVTMTPTSGLTTTESTGQATFTIVLNSQPTADVTIGLTSSNTAEGTITQSNVTFTAANWSSAQTLTVTGVDDAVADGNQPYTILTAPATSGDPSYRGLDASNAALINIDNDSASIIMSRTSGLVTTEAAASDVFTVALGSQPTADVTITLTSSDLGEGSVVPTTLVFTSANWDLTQTVTVTGADDSLADGNQIYTVVMAPATSTDAGYRGMDAVDVSVTNLDNDLPGLTLDPTGGLFVSEFGDFDTFTIVLNTQPLADVRIALSSSDLTEGTVNPASVTFTAANWNVPQTVTVTGVNDALADGSQIFLVVTGAAVSTDAGYNGLNPPDVDVTNFDNDTPGVYVKARRLLRTAESGQNSTIKVRLTTQPTANVTCTFASSDNTEGTAAPTTVIFTPADFATLQSITVAGMDDAVTDGDQLYSVLSAPCTSTDFTYNSFDPRDLAVINRDND